MVLDWKKDILVILCKLGSDAISGEVRNALLRLVRVEVLS
jgi:hypothetical protein